jgi:hypothetical protein
MVSSPYDHADVRDAANSGFQDKKTPARAGAPRASRPHVQTFRIVVYTATESGRLTLQIGKDRVRELLLELIEEDDS